MTRPIVAARGSANRAEPGSGWGCLTRRAIGHQRTSSHLRRSVDSMNWRDGYGSRATSCLRQPSMGTTAVTEYRPRPRDVDGAATAHRRCFDAIPTGL